MLIPRDDAASEAAETSEFVRTTLIQQYGQFTILTLAVYEILLTYRDEVEFFWGATVVNPVAVVFFVNRYVGLFGAIVIMFWNFYNMSKATCAFTLWSDNICGSIAIASIEYILLRRVLALYSGHRWFSVCLMILFCLTAASKFGFSIYGSWDQKATTTLIAEGYSLCAVDGENVPSIIIALIDWLIPLAYGVILMIVAVSGAAVYWNSTAGFSGSKLVRVVVRDQIVYFFFVLSCSICNILQIKVAIQNQTLAYILQTVGNPYMMTILGNRMLFNLKKAARRGFNEGTNYRPKSLSIMEFEMPEAPPLQERSDSSNHTLNPCVSRDAVGYT